MSNFNIRECAINGLTVRYFQQNEQIFLNQQQNTKAFLNEDKYSIYFNTDDILAALKKDHVEIELDDIYESMELWHCSEFEEDFIANRIEQLSEYMIRDLAVETVEILGAPSYISMDGIEELFESADEESLLEGVLVNMTFNLARVVSDVISKPSRRMEEEMLMEIRNCDKIISEKRQQSKSALGWSDFRFVDEIDYSERSAYLYAALAKLELLASNQRQQVEQLWNDVKDRAGWMEFTEDHDNEFNILINHGHTEKISYSFGCYLD